MSSVKKQYLALLCLALMIVCLTVVVKKWHFGLRGNLGDPALNSDLTLLQLIRERQREIAPFYTLNHVHGSLEVQSTSPGSGAVRNTTLGSEVGCSDLSGVTVVDFLGAGYTKTVLKVVLAQGLEVALKTVNHQGTDMRSCLEDFRDPAGCQDLVSFKLRKEIILLQRLQHPNIVEVMISEQEQTPGSLFFFLSRLYNRDDGCLFYVDLLLLWVVYNYSL